MAMKGPKRAGERKAEAGRLGQDSQKPEKIVGMVQAGQDREDRMART
jgi:hypothetical protein